jgi:glycosyltransferase involved in cell wall biosynthesis
LKVLLFVQFFPPVAFGGSEYQFLQYAKELVRRGNEVHVVTQRVGGARDTEIISGVMVHRVGVRTNYRGTQPRLFPDSISYVLSAIKKGLQLSRCSKTDIIHSNTHLPAFAGAFCSLITRIPHVITVHDVFLSSDERFRKDWASQQHLPSAVARFIPIFERLALGLPTRVLHAVSESTKNDLIRNGFCNKKIVVIPNGIPVEEYGTGGYSPPRGKRVLFIGRLVFYKNLETIIRSWREVLESVPEARLVIVGDGPLRNQLKLLAREEGVTGSVDFMGWVDHQVKLKCIKESSFLVLPSICEGFGIVIIEAFACARPVIVSDLPPMNAIIDNSIDGYTADPFDPQLWARLIITLLRQPVLCSQMGIQGLNKVTSVYTIQHVVDMLERLYWDIQGKPR